VRSDENFAHHGRGRDVCGPRGCVLIENIVILWNWARRGIIRAARLRVSPHGEVGGVTPSQRERPAHATY